MIFDTPRFEAIRLKYKDQPDYLWPMILRLDHWKENTDEKVLLEELINEAGAKEQKDWINRLINKDDSSFLGAWFEINLFGWLSSFTKTEIQQEIEGDKPDYSITVGGKKIIIEAGVKRITDLELHKLRIEDSIWHLVSQIQIPFTVEINMKNIIDIPNTNRLQNELSSWIFSPSDNDLVYTDEHGNEILSSRFFKNLMVISSVDFKIVNEKQISPVIIDKSKQHKAIRAKKYPYIIALFLEAPELSATSAMEAWFGKEQWIFDKNTMRFDHAQFDKTGLSHREGVVQHDSISGLLVFKRINFQNEKRYCIKGWYVENPFCNPDIYIDETIFPIVGSFGVIERFPDRLELGWKKGLSNLRRDQDNVGGIKAIN
jgi:hypothetical protein